MDYNLYDGMFTFFCALVLCVCAVSGLTAFHTDRCRRSGLCEVVPCVACVRALSFVH